MTNPDLAALSAAATQGPWKKGAKRNCDIDIIGKPTWPCTRYGKKGEWDVAVVTELENVKEQQANAAFIVSLVNEYRAGRLVQIDEGMREATARAEAAEARNKVLEMHVDILEQALIDHNCGSPSCICVGCIEKRDPALGAEHE